MDSDSDFRKPVFVDPKGLYLTTVQLQFFLNRGQGYDLVKRNSPQFKEYYLKCIIYNYVWDLMEQDSSVADLCWDDKSESIMLRFPHNGVIMEELSKKGLLGPIHNIEEQ